MILETLKSVDKDTANGILAAAALATAANPGVRERPTVLKAYAEEADQLLSEVRVRLKLTVEDTSPKAHAAIDSFLARELAGSIFKGADTNEVFARVGQAGHLPPSRYNVVQLETFKNTFYKLGVSAANVEDAVRFPTDYQHLMTEGAPESELNRISIFLKRIESKIASKDHWLLVQTHRGGLDQVVQSAWRVYPDDVDLGQASEPIDMLRSFARTYGSPIRVGDAEALFVDSLTFPIDAEVKVDWGSVEEADWFVSFTHIANRETKLLNVGAAYCIRLRDYRAAHRRHGLNVHPRSPAQ